MKKNSAWLLLSFLLIVGLLVFVLWQFIPHTSTEKEPQNQKKVRIGFSLGDLREERWQKDRDFFVEAATKLGAYVQVMSANSDAELQNNQIENLISQRVDVLVIAPYDSEKLVDVLSMARQANIKVIAYDRLIKNADVDFYVSFDNAQVGRMEAEGVVAAQRKGNFAYIGGAPTDNNSSLLKQGSMEVLQPLIDSGEVKLIVDTFTPDWKPEEAYKTIKNYLASGGTIDAVVAANDGTAFGVIRALAEYDLAGKVPVSGQDAELSACQRVVEGTQTLTVYKPIVSLAEKAAEIAVQLASGKEVESTTITPNGKTEIPSHFLTPTMVTKLNMDDTVVKDGYHAKNQIYKL